MMDVTKFLDENTNICILGDRNTAKTNLMFWLASEYKGKREVIFYGYPDQSIPYRQIYSLQELSLTTDSIVMMDELQRHIKIYNSKTNADFLELLSTMIHNNNTLVFSTPLTQSITKATDNFLECFLYTRVSDMHSLKNGSKAKRWLQHNSFIEVSKWSVNIPIGQFILISNTLKGLFAFPDMKIGKDWKSRKFLEKNKPKNPKKIRPKAN